MKWHNIAMDIAFLGACYYFGGWTGFTCALLGMIYAGIYIAHTRHTIRKKP